MILNKFKYITDPENARVQDNGMRKYQWGEKLPCDNDPLRSP